MKFIYTCISSIILNAKNVLVTLRKNYLTDNITTYFPRPVVRVWILVLVSRAHAIKLRRYSHCSNRFI